MFQLLFLPFIIFENIVGGIAMSLNLPPPPQFFSQIEGSRQRLALPSPKNFIKGAEEVLPPLPKLGTSYENEETWEWQDYRGRERKITVHRNARER